jgi:hypothetical protein
MRPRWEQLWDDKKAVFKLVEERLGEQMEAYHAFIFTGRPHQLTEAQLRVIDPHLDRNRKWDEQTAVEEAKRGNLKPLAFHVLMPDPVPEFDTEGKIIKVTYENNDQIAHLKPETWFLIIEFLLGDRSLKSGRKRGERNPKTGKVTMRGAPKVSEEKKRKRWRAIRAADLYKAVIEILRGEFPEQRTKEIRDRAIEFAASKTGMSELSLFEHIKKGRRTRRVLPGV